MIKTADAIPRTEPSPPVTTRRQLLLSLGILASGLTSGLTLALARPTQAADPDPTSPNARTLLDAVVRIDAEVPLQSSTARELGRERVASGVVLTSDGYILTTAETVIEATVITTSWRNGRHFPASLAGFDTATGLALLKVWAGTDNLPTLSSPLSLMSGTTNATELSGSAVEIGEEVLAITSHGQRALNAVMVTDKRSFAGGSEFLLEEALITSPPIRNHEGAALINRTGRLIGIGTRLLTDAVPRHRNIPGNLFVPLGMDALASNQSQLGDLLRHGRTMAPERPWLGLTVQQAQAGFLVTSVWPGGPASVGGLRPGDIITALAGQRPASLAGLWRILWSAGPAGSEIALERLRGTSLQSMVLRSADQVRHMGLAPTL